MSADLETVNQIERRFDIDKPTADDVRTAAMVLAHLLRFLNHATLPDRAAQNLPYPSSVSVVTDNLRTAARRLPQLVEQLADRMDQLAGDSKLYDDGMGKPLEEKEGHPLAAHLVAPTRARLAAVALREAGSVASFLELELDKAYQQTDRLGVRTPPVA
jgi:hypothetical protein